MLTILPALLLMSTCEVEPRVKYREGTAEDREAYFERRRQEARDKYIDRTPIQRDPKLNLNTATLEEMVAELPELEGKMGTEIINRRPYASAEAFDTAMVEFVHPEIIGAVQGPLLHPHRRQQSRRVHDPADRGNHRRSRQRPDRSPSLPVGRSVRARADPAHVARHRPVLVPLAGSLGVSPDQRETRLRHVLWAVTGLICVFAPIELWITGHIEPGPQLIPFVLSGLGLVAVFAGAFRPSPRSLKGTRWVMAAMLLGSVFGVWEHLEHNFEFAAEIAPNAGFQELAIEAVMGANPLLAPGIFAVAAICGWAAAWAHPAE